MKCLLSIIKNLVKDIYVNDPLFTNKKKFLKKDVQIPVLLSSTSFLREKKILRYDDKKQGTALIM